LVRVSSGGDKIILRELGDRRVNASLAETPSALERSGPLE